MKKRNFGGAHLDLIRKFAIQLFHCLKYLKKHRIIHCDIKPENILFNGPGDSSIKIVDFGSSCFETNKLFSYIQSRYYRAPEVILGIHYNSSIDIWSVGCVLAELYTGSVLFRGESEEEQISLFIECLGAPDKFYLSTAKYRKSFFEENGDPIIEPNSKGVIHNPGTKPLSKSLGCENTKFLDLIQRCLEWDPKKRITPEEALAHEWIIEDLTISIKGTKTEKKFVPLLEPNRISQFVNKSVNFDQSKGINHKILLPDIRRSISKKNQSFNLSLANIEVNYSAKQLKKRQRTVGATKRHILTSELTNIKEKPSVNYYLNL